MTLTLRCLCSLVAVLVVSTCLVEAQTRDKSSLVEDFMAGRTTGGAFIRMIGSSGASEIPFIRDALARTEDPEKSALLIEALHALKADGLERDIKTALEKTKGKQRESLEYKALIFLRGISTNIAVRTALDIIRESRSEDVRQLVRGTVEMMQGQDAAEVFIEELMRKDGLVELSIEKLGNMRVKEAAVLLLPFLKNEDTGVRNLAAKALYSIADKRTMDALEESLVEEGDEFVRMRIDSALLRMGSIKAAERLRERFGPRKAFSEVRIYSVDVYFHASFMGMVDDLIELTKDEQPLVRGRAVALLSGAGCVSAIPALEEISRKDPWESLRKDSLEVIEKLQKKGPCLYEKDF